MTKDEALDLALEALEESVDLVREDYENAKKLYSNYPSRQARLLGLEDGLSKHEAAITAIKQARAAPVQDIDWKDMYEKEKRRSEMWVAKYEKDIGPLEYAVPVAAPVQEPDHGDELTIAYMSGLHDGKNKRKWVGLTDEEVSQLIGGMPHGKMVRAIEAKLKEKNT